eukprot:Skav205894  [mRNA]  locus=scaffold123:150420:151178:+ [translate_table: standard]
MAEATPYEPCTVLAAVLDVDIVLEQVVLATSTFGVIFKDKAMPALCLTLILTTVQLSYDVIKTVCMAICGQKQRFEENKKAWNIKQADRIINVATLLMGAFAFLWIANVPEAAKEWNDFDVDGETTQEGTTAHLVNVMLSVLGGGLDVAEWLPVFVPGLQLAIDALAGLFCEPLKGWSALWSTNLAMFVACVVGFITLVSDLEGHGMTTNGETRFNDVQAIALFMGIYLCCMMAFQYLFFRCLLKHAPVPPC